MTAPLPKLNSCLASVQQHTRQAGTASQQQGHHQGTTMNKLLLLAPCGSNKKSMSGLRAAAAGKVKEAKEQQVLLEPQPKYLVINLPSKPCSGSSGPATVRTSSSPLPALQGLLYQQMMLEGVANGSATTDTTILNLIR
jgi:hypothetical protein